MELFDGAGGIYRAVIETVDPAAVTLSILSRSRACGESSLAITLAMGFLKDKKMDTLVRQLTELGIRSFLPFFCRRSIPRPDEERMRKRKSRWEKIAREAVKQCGRGRREQGRPGLCRRFRVGDGEPQGDAQNLYNSKR